MKSSNNSESTRRREHPEAPQVADSSGSSSDSSTDTEMGLVDVFTIFCENSERATGKPVAVAEGREGGHSERATVKPAAVAERREGGHSERATWKPVAVAEEREGGPVTLDLTKWDFNKADCRTRCRNLIEIRNCCC